MSNYNKIYYPYPATDTRHKYFIITADGKKVNFGSIKNKDYTIYYKEEGPEVAIRKKDAYIARHSKLNEDYTKNGINTAGWWSLNYLWNKPTKEESYNDIKRKLLNYKVITKE